MNSIRINKDSKIFIFCPNGLVTGGPEALHQLRFYMEQEGYQAYLVYEFSGNLNPPERYMEYEPKVVSFQQVTDDKRNVLIVPEVSIGILQVYHSIQKCVWFLSWGYYDISVKDRLLIGCKNIVKRFFNCFIFDPERKFRLQIFSRRKQKNVLYCCGSEYAYQHVVSDLKVSDAVMLVEPISMDFLREGPAKNLTSCGRGDIVLYNPSKPSEVMRKLLERTDIQFQPLKGYTPVELIEIYRKSKLYIDFGQFGGPERIPKESVYNGTCVLVGRRNAAENDFDVAIPGAFKIGDFENVDAIADRIRDMLLHYDDLIGEFAHFRNKIDNLEQNFKEQIRSIFLMQEE